ncbi:glycosyltransferase family 2 protein [Thermospira aquatica]|uniref:Glycosyltransferase family 2 protein n=1 Tax=Thermospira aquatica TaxID=2828656 RepID=A0AAX3BB74_9SPIR|nr:glycosyltransferase family 2 protein [Thermospira aquatica]URA09279.1 glycosyltransferase family 2 protein [Thermospira aquatica]
MHPTERIPIAHLLEGRLLSIIMPFYNEGRVIVENVRSVLHACEEMGLAVEVVAVDDGSTDDGYQKLLQAYRHDMRVVPIRNETNFGKGWALKTGYEFSRGEFVLFLDSDLELSPWHLPQFFHRLFESQADVVIGSKLHPESIVNYPFMRRVLSLGYYGIIRLLFRLPVMDTQTGIKLFKREALEYALPRTLVKRFAFDIELLVVMISKGFRVIPAPIFLHFNRQGIGNIRLRTIWNIFFDTMAVVYRFYILRYYQRELGPSVRYRYRVVLFSGGMNEQEHKNLMRYLSLPYVEYDVVLLGEKAPDVSHPKLSWIEAKEVLFSERLLAHPEFMSPERDLYLFGTLAFSPDQKIFLNTGRLLSLEDVGMVGGWVMVAPDETTQGRFFYHVVRSTLLNGPLAYRYKHGVQKKVSELGLEGMFVKREVLDQWHQLAPQLSGDKYEHQLSLACEKLQKDILYSPDIIMFGYFPQSFHELLDWLKGRARIRAHQREGLFWWYVLIGALMALWVLALCAPWFSYFLLLPWGVYYTFVLLVWPLSSPERGIRKLFQGAVLAISQIVYIWYFVFQRITRHSHYHYQKRS